MTTGRINQVVSVPFEIHLHQISKWYQHRLGFLEKTRASIVYARHTRSVAPECGLPSARARPRQESSTLKSLLMPRSPLMRHSISHQLSSQIRFFSRGVPMHKLNPDAFSTRSWLQRPSSFCGPSSLPIRAEIEEAALSTVGGLQTSPEYHPS